MEVSVKKNAVLLTLMILAKKGLSIVYKIPYQNLTGDAGFYVFQQVYPFIAMLMILTGFALPTVIGSLLIENNYSATIKDKLKRSMWIFSLTIFTLIFLGNHQIALIMGDVRLAPVIRVAGIHFLFLPSISYMRGVLQSRPETIRKFGYSVVIEQISRVIAVLITLYSFNTHNQNHYRIAELVFISTLISPVVTMMHLYLMKPIDDAGSFLPLVERPQLFRRTMYLVLGSGVLVIFGLIDSFLVFNTLITLHSHTDAMVLRGVLERGLPIVQTGTFFVSSLVSLTMSQFEKAKNEKQKKIAFSTGLFYILGLAIPATFGLVRVMPYLNIALFTDQKGNSALQLMMIQVVFYSVIVLLTATLSREDRQPFVLSSLLIGILTKLIITVPLIRQNGIDGAALSSVISLGIMSVIMLIGSKYLFTPRLIVIFMGISFSTLIMCIALHYAGPLLAPLHIGERSGYLSLLLTNTVIGMVIYGLALITLIGIFRATGKAILLRHQRKKERAERAARARKRRHDERIRLQEEQRQEALRLQEEALERAQYRQSLMHDLPKQKNQVTVNDHLDGRGHGQRSFYSERPQGGQLQSPSEQQVDQQIQLAYSHVEPEPINPIRKERKQMRLDKFLKVSRIIKRRQTAKEVSDAGKISVNGKIAKSSTSLSVGDEIALHYATRTLVVRVLEIKDSTKKEDADRMYEIVREEAVVGGH